MKDYVPEGEKLGVLFVCLGNICRSPVAEGTFRHLVKERGLSSRFRIDSAGTGAYHVGESPNPNAKVVAARHGILLEHSARQFQHEDFSKYHYIFTMDRNNYEDVLRLASTPGDREKVILFRHFDPHAQGAGHPPDVPDPYYGGMDGFERVQEIISRTAAALLDHLVAKHFPG